MSRGFEITKDWQGNPTNLQYKLKLSIVSGDLQLYVDAPYFKDTFPPQEECDDEFSSYTRSVGEACGLRHVQLGAYECVTIFIASGMEDIPLESREYLEIVLGPHGHYLIVGYGGQGDENGDSQMLFEQHPESTINLDTNRWSVKASIPFFFLPGPGEDPRDPLALTWYVNFCAVHDLPHTVQGREYLSHVPLRGTIPNFHQLEVFVPLQLSDASSQRLRSMSRASVSAKSITSSWGAGALEAGAMDTPTRLARDLGAASTLTGSTMSTFQKLGVKEVLQYHLSLHKNSTKTIFSQLMSEKDLKSISSQHLQPGEEMVLCGKYWKRKGWAHHRCILILTSLPKLIYVDASSPFTYRGIIDWKMTRPLRPMKTSEERFDIELADGSRTYHFFDEEGHGVDKWIQAIDQVNASWKAYLQESLGEYDPDVQAFMRGRGPNAKKKGDSGCFIL